MFSELTQNLVALAPAESVLHAQLRVEPLFSNPSADELLIELDFICAIVVSDNLEGRSMGLLPGRVFEGL
jgi:hypothetical protein